MSAASDGAAARAPIPAPRGSPAAGSSDCDREVVFYTICTPDYFVGLVGLLNSLRILGHRERVVVLDCGLSADQRAVLSGHCEVVRSTTLEAASTPCMYKAFAHSLAPRGVAVIIDSDMIVTRRLDGPLEAARAGKICLFLDAERDRWFAEWASIFGVEAPLRRQPYATTSLVVFSTQHWPRLLDRWWSCCARIMKRPSLYEGAANSDPVAQADQDAFNALLMSEIPEEAFLGLPDSGIVQCSFESSTVLDAATLKCRFKGETPYVLHWPGRPKPWSGRGWSDWRVWSNFSPRNPYVILLRRLLTWNDVAIRLPGQVLSLRLRPGIAGAAVTFATLVRAQAGSAVRAVLGA